MDSILASKQALSQKEGITVEEKLMELFCFASGYELISDIMEMFICQMYMKRIDHPVKNVHKVSQ